MTSTATVYKSRWGYHPCDYEVFAKLKALHARYWRTVYEFHRWHRWFRKQPQNRRPAEPQYCPVFVKNETWYKPVHRRGEAGCKVYPKTVTDHGLIALYQQARQPQPEPVAPFDQNTTALIEDLYSRLEQ